MLAKVLVIPVLGSPDCWPEVLATGHLDSRLSLSSLSSIKAETVPHSQVIAARFPRSLPNTIPSQLVPRSKYHHSIHLIIKHKVNAPQNLLQATNFHN
jgi:hypothetical protein